MIHVHIITVMRQKFDKSFDKNLFSNEKKKHKKYLSQTWSYGGWQWTILKPNTSLKSKYKWMTDIHTKTKLLQEHFPGDPEWKTISLQYTYFPHF